MTAEAFFAYVAACVILSIVPGPNVTIIVANSLRGGTRAGLASVAGTQVGVFIVLMILALGLQVLVANAGVFFDWLRLVGAAYLAWLGVKMLLSDGKLGSTAGGMASMSTCFWQGCIVFLSNPKALVFFGAFIPQFIDPAGDTFSQVMFLGGTFMVVTTSLDSAYALAAGRAGQLLSRSRIKLVERVSGCCMIAGGLWLALARR